MAAWRAFRGCPLPAGGWDRLLHALGRLAVTFVSGPGGMRPVRPLRSAFGQSFDSDHVKSHLRVTLWSLYDQKMTRKARNRATAQTRIVFRGVAAPPRTTRGTRDADNAVIVDDPAVP
jgi:hypothetical protein